MSTEAELSPAGIRRVREVREETQVEFGEVIGVSHKTIGKWERGETRPSEKKVEMIGNQVFASLTRDACYRYVTKG